MTYLNFSIQKYHNSHLDKLNRTARAQTKVANSALCKNLRAKVFKTHFMLYYDGIDNRLMYVNFMNLIEPFTKFILKLTSGFSYVTEF